MRSHPYESPPPLPPMISNLGSLVQRPNPAHHASESDRSSSIPLSSLDHDTSRLLKPRTQQHHVWVQGRLAPVRTASSPHSMLDVSTTARVKKRDTMRDLETPRRKSFGDDPWQDDAGDIGRLGEDTAIRHSQPRGYGIGGAGNIRRPTEVVHGPAKTSDSFWKNCFFWREASQPKELPGPDKYGHTGYRKGKGKLMPAS